MILYVLTPEAHKTVSGREKIFTIYFYSTFILTF